MQMFEPNFSTNVALQQPLYHQRFLRLLPKTQNLPRTHFIRLIPFLHEQEASIRYHPQLHPEIILGHQTFSSSSAPELNHFFISAYFTCSISDRINLSHKYKANNEVFLQHSLGCLSTMVIVG